MVIDLESFQAINVDSNGVATVGAGVRLGNLALGIYNKAKRALPHGTCPGVGIGGHFTHGGYGYDSRKWGLALDTIVGLDVVLADGSFIHASSTAYPDIYWVGDLHILSLQDTPQSLISTSLCNLW
jgi:FAD/FMN-containing dehydrogenase